MRRFYLSIAMLFGGAELCAQNITTEPLWIQYMLEPRPNYNKVKQAFTDYWKDSIPSRGHGYKVFKRWEWRALQHLDQNGDVVWPQQQLNDFTGQNPQGLNQGGNSHGGTMGGTMGGSMSACPAGGRWNKVGPTRSPYNQTSQPTGVGRVSGIAFHPKDSNTYFACTPQAGLWKTTDNGQTWKLLFGNGSVVNSIGCNALLLSYNNADTMYMGTGDRDAGDAPGYGVLASWNGGKTWVTRNSGMGNVTVGRMVMHKKNSAILLASTNSGIYRTTNGGASWSLVLSGGAWDVVYHPENPAIVYAAIGGAFYRSTDGGVNWSVVTSGLPTTSIYRGMIGVSPASRGYVYFLITSGSTYRGMYRSADSGSNFSTMSTTPNILGYSESGSDANGQGWYDLDVAVDPKNASIVYVAGINIWKSTNGGSTWTVCGHWVGSGGADDIHADQHALEYNITGRKLYAGNDGGIYYSTNAGSRWNNITSGIQNSQIYRLAQAKTDAFAGAQGYQDNGSSQTQEDEFYTYYGGDGMDCQVDPTDHSYVYGSYVNGRIYRAINKNTIITLGVNGTNGINETGGWLTPFILREGSPAVMWAGYNNVWRCDNVKSTGAITWTKLSTGWSGTITRLENSPANNKLLFVIRGDGKLFKSTDATITSPAWTDLSASQPASIRYVEAHHKNANVVYACNATNLYKSTNQGSSWTSLGTLPSGSGNMNCLYLDTSSKTETIYIGSEKGVYVWDSAAGSVSEFNTGFPLWADVTDLDIYYSPNGKGSNRIVAATYGMGVWRSNVYDNGSVKPKSGFYAFDSVFVTGGKMRLFENIQYGITSLTWKITPYSYNYIEGTDSLSANPVISFNGPGLFSVQLMVSNCNGNDTFTRKHWIKVFPPTAGVNCTNTTSWQSVNYAMGIMKLTLADNKSETGGYFDDGENLDMSSRKVFRLKPSTSYTATIKTGLYNNEYVRLYLDYNNNGKFENYLNEVSTLSSAVIGNRNITFTTPASLKPNQAMRLRVISDFYSIDTNACKNLSYGQGEDYTLIYERTTPLFKVSKTSICAYENITFTDTSEGLIGAYEWSFGSGAVPSTAIGKGPHTVYYTSTGNKDVRLRINGIDSLRKTGYVTVGSGQAPQVLVKSGSATGCEGRSLTLAVRATNGVAFTVQWQKNGVDMAGKTDTLLVLSSIAASDAATYRAITVSGSCTSSSGNIAVQSDSKPTVGFGINTTPQCFKYNQFNFTNSSTVSSGTIAQNKWSLGDGTVQNSTHSSRSYTAVGTYNVKLVCTSDKGCKDSATKTATVNTNGVPRFAVNDSDQCISGNNFVFANNSTVSSGSLTYLWQFGDGNTSSTTSPTKSYGSNGTYSVLLISTTTNGCKDTFVKPLRVYSKPAVSFTLNNTAQCFKGHNFVTSNSSSNTDGSITHNWNFDDGYTTASVSPSHRYAAFGSYNVKLITTSIYGCKDSSTQSVVIHPQATLKASANDSDQCLNGNSFSFNNTSSIPIGTLSYFWQFGDGNSSNAVSPSHSYTSHGIYNALLIATSDKNCKDTLNKSIRVYSQPKVGYNINSASQCLKNNSFLFTNTSSNFDGGMAYFWNYVSGNSTSRDLMVSYITEGVFSVELKATTNFGCADSISTNVTVNPQGSIEFSVNDSDQCMKGNSFYFSNNSSISTGSLSYIWNFGDNTTSGVISPLKSYSASGSYLVTLFSATNAGCKDTVTKLVQVFEQPSAVFSTNQTEQCARNNNFVFTNASSISTGSMASYWNFGDGNVQNTSDASHSYAAWGMFEVKLLAISDKGCRDSALTEVKVFERPDVQYSLNDSSQCEPGNLFEFSNFTTLNTGWINGYEWYFGDGNSSVAKDPLHHYLRSGVYAVGLMVRTNDICLDTLHGSVRVNAQPEAKFQTLEDLNRCLNGNHYTSLDQSTIAEGSIQTLWDNGDGTYGDGKSNEHVYSLHGVYHLKLVARSDEGCEDTAEKEIHLHPSPRAAFTTEKSEYCENDLIRLENASDIASGRMQYSWNLGQGEASTSDTPVIQFAGFGVFKIVLEVVSDMNCRDTAEQNVQVASVPVASFAVWPPVGCAGQTEFRFSDSSVNLDKRQLNTRWWFTNDDSAVGKVVARTFDSAGIYNIRLAAYTSACSVDTIMQLRVQPEVKADFVYTHISNETVRFVALDTLEPLYSYIWHFGDGRIGAGQKATHTYGLNSEFLPKLIVRNAIGCMDSSSGSAIVKSPNNLLQDNPLNFYLYPNPNNGKFTYKFEVTSERTVEVKIFDMLGQSALYTKIWKQVAPGMYYEDVDLQALGVAPGTYPLTIVSGEDKLVVKVVFAR